MRLYLIFLSIVALLFSNFSLANSLTSTYTQKELLKNWVLSRCLGKVYGNPSVKDDADSTASAYLEYGKQPIETYHALDKLADKYAKLKYSGAISSDFNTMKCIDLFYSKELDNFVNQQVSKK